MTEFPGLCRAVVLTLLLFSSASPADIATNMSRIGRDLGFSYLYYVQGGTTLVRGVCADPDLPPSRVNCRDRKLELDLEGFLDAFAPGFERKISLLTQEWRVLNFGRTFLDLLFRSARPNLSNMMVPDYIRELQTVTEMPRLTQVERILRGISERSGGLLSTIRKLRDETEVHELYAGQMIPERHYVQHFDRLARAQQHRVGGKCRQESARFITQEGGCKDRRTGLVWGKAMTGIDDFDYLFWTTRMGALRHCLSTSFGGRIGSRLPTESELRGVSGPASSYLEWETSAYFWTITTEMRNHIVQREVRLPGGRRFAGNDEVYIGGTYKPFDRHPTPTFSSYPRYQDINRTLNATFQYRTEVEKLVRPADGHVFEIQRNSLVAASGTVFEQYRDVVTRPTMIAPHGFTGEPVTHGSQEIPAGGGSRERSVNPLAFVDFQVPDVTRTTIGLMCVHE